jgi:glycosyltransferase involved in cell wall biosynthesis
MKVAISSLYLPSGSKIGVGYQVHALANSLMVRGHAVTVFSPCEKPEGAAYEVRTTPRRKSLRTFGFPWDLRRENFEGFDVLNAHGDDWFLWGVDRPRHVHTYHGSCFAEMLHMRGLKERLRMGLLAACETQAALLADETVAVSENTRRFIPGIRHVIPCGVDTSKFAPGDPSGRSEAPSILFVGTMHGRKRGAMLLEVFEKEIKRRVPTAELWCVCENEVSGPGVRGFGRVSDAVLADLYRRAWVFCLPSSYEGFGVPYVEALASGVPVVSTPNVGAREVLAEGAYGRICEEAKLAEALVELLGDRETRERMTERGLVRAKDFSWLRVCERYERVYVGRAAERKASA